MKRYIIPVFIPHHGCPHQCVFCDQRAITGTVLPPTAREVTDAIRSRLARLTQPRAVEIAFYGGSFTALPAARQHELLAPAARARARGEVAAIRVSTRPDAIDAAAVKRLQDHGVTTVELGVQSLDDNVLAAAGRGHTAADTAAAVATLKAAGFATGFQLMPGLPGEDWPSLIATGRRLLALGPDFIRIYPAVVLAGTPLAAMLAAGAYRPLTLAAAVARAAFLKLAAENRGIAVIRTGLQATAELSGGAVLAGPYHPAFGLLVEAFLFRVMIGGLLEKFPGPPGPVVLRHHPRDASAVRGLKNANLEAWRSAGLFTACRLLADWPRRGEAAVVWRDMTVVINKAMIYN